MGRGAGARASEARKTAPALPRTPRAPRPDLHTELGYERYKLVVQVVLGENRQQGVRVISRCLWDPDTDNFTSYSYKNVRGGLRLSLRRVHAAVVCIRTLIVRPRMRPTLQDTMWCTAMVFGTYVD